MTPLRAAVFWRGWTQVQSGNGAELTWVKKEISSFDLIVWSQSEHAQIIPVQ